ncbi:hypothetical protein ACS0TY_015300 [Phlomoides rotata]
MLEVEGRPSLAEIAVIARFPICRPVMRRVGGGRAAHLIGFFVLSSSISPFSFVRSLFLEIPASGGIFFLATPEPSLRSR